LKQWIQKLIDQLDYDWKSGKAGSSNSSSTDIEARNKTRAKMSDERATLLYVVDTYSKHLVEVEHYPIRRVREELDQFAKEMVDADKDTLEDVLFRFRQYFMSYKTAEYAFLRKTFEDFKGIVWNFVEQLSDEAQNEQQSDHMLGTSLKDLKEAVEADSIPLLRAKSREFIDVYMVHQAKKEERRVKRVKTIKKNLDGVKRQLVEADRAVRMDHLTGAFNRKSFDEHLKQQHQLFQLSNTPVSVLSFDIDFFKKINDNYGHDIGDFMLKECVKLLQDVFKTDHDFVARVGGEEFVVVLSGHNSDHAVKRAEEVMARIRKEVFVEKNMELRFTASMGIAQLLEGESVEQLMKRADQALYDSKHNGRNRFTLARTLSSAA
jgi:diguanylate cyclase